MITTRTKRQLVVFVILTLVGVSFVGARYAKLDRIFFDNRYTVTAQFADSGGIFAGSEVTYRGVHVGEVSALQLTRTGINVVMKIDKSGGEIPADTLAVVANKSAVGEQYVDLQPQTDSKPYLTNGSVIKEADTQVPVPTVKLLTNLDNLVNSVPQGDLRTVVSQFGTAFEGTGKDLGQIIDTSNAFIRAANQNFGTTAALIRDSDTVLGTQVDKTSAIRSFSRDLALFSGTLAGSDADLRKVIDNGSATTDQLRTFLQENRVDLGQLINKLVINGKIVVQHLHGIRQVLVIYPYVVEGAYSVIARDPKDKGAYNADFGIVLTNSVVCGSQSTSKPADGMGYGSTDRRGPVGKANQANRPMNTDARCTATDRTFRGNRWTPANRAATGYQAAPVATYDPSTGRVTWTGSNAAKPAVTYTGGARDTFGKDSWKWLLLQPVSTQE